ncbi:tetratricopeptide repeat protein [Weeksellaceae bacterium A-14]
MKKVMVSLALLSVVFTFAQKKEISAAMKAVDSGDLSTASAKISEAESALGGKTYLLEPKLLEELYYAKGMSLLKSGKPEGAEILSKIGELSSNKIYTGKDGKEKVYFVGKEAADKSGISGLKEETYSPELLNKLKESLNPMIQSSHKSAMDAYNAKKYSEAAPKFAEVYNLLKATGNNDQQYLYYSAITYALAKDNPKAIAAYNELINSGYTGIETKYTAKNKKTNEVENLDKSSWELMKKAGGDYTDFKTEQTKSVEQELYETDLGLLMDSQRYDEAIALADKALKKFPGNSTFSDLKGLAYYKSGKTEEFANSLKEAVAKNPNDKNSWYNLGVIASKDPAKISEAEEYFKKAVAIDPKFANAWQNLTFLKMGDHQKALDDYNTARKAGKIDEANKIIEARRKRFVDALPYAEKWYEADPTNIDAVSILKSLYNSAGNTAKSAEFKAKEEAMKKAMDASGK